MLEQPISPELAMIDPLDARREAGTAGPSAMAEASSMSVEALLFQAGLITADQLGELVRDSVVLNRPAAEVALERGLVSSAALQEVLAKASAPAPDSLPFPLPVETLPLHAVPEVEAPLEPEVVAEVQPVVVPELPLQPVSPFSPEALEALLAAVPIAEAARIEVALPEAPAEPAMPAFVAEQIPPVVLLPDPMPVAVEPMPVAVAEPMPVAVEPMPVAVAEPMPVAVEPMPVAVEPMPVAVEPMPVAVEPMPAAVEPMPVATTFAVLLRLQTGERIPVDRAASFETASEVARGLADRFAGATEWPLLAGRYIRPDAVVSVDIERALEA
jgi:hypothetical protein